MQDCPESPEAPSIYCQLGELVVTHSNRRTDDNKNIFSQVAEKLKSWFILTLAKQLEGKKRRKKKEKKIHKNELVSSIIL